MVPTAGLLHQLFPAGCRKAVIFRLAIVLGSAPKRRDPAPILQPIEGRIQRPVFHLQEILGPPFNHVRDSLAMRGAGSQCLENHAA